MLDDQQNARRSGNEPGGCADSPLHAREETPQRHRDHEHNAVRSGQSAGQHGRTQFHRNGEDDRYSIKRTVLQCDGAGDCTRGGR